MMHNKCCLLWISQNITFVIPYNPTLWNENWLMELEECLDGYAAATLIAIKRFLLPEFYYFYLILS